MKILSAERIKQLDQYTIAHEPIASIDLMERAARACANRLEKLISTSQTVVVFCGKGNNGGDGLAISRLMAEKGLKVRTYLVNYTDNFSADAKINFELLKEKFPETLLEISSIAEIKSFEENTVIVDALLGTGTNKAIEGLLKEIVLRINTSGLNVISIDMPSGLYCDQTSSEREAIVCSSLTLSFQFPKLAFLLPENKKYVPEFELLNIGLHEKGLDTLGTNYHYITKNEVQSLLKPRTKFSHKGSYGHALLLAGSRGKSGSAIISSKGCMRSGAGLLTLHSTAETLATLLYHLPEAMSSKDSNPNHITEILEPEKYGAIGFGPGVGTHEETQTVLKKLLNYYNGKLIIDADGLNILSENKTWLDFLIPGTILTPHPKEFERLTEKHENDFERLKALRKFSSRYNCIVILKGAHSVTAMPDGALFFNSTGNAGLAKAGSGDGLTGIILGLLTRGYNAPQAALIGTFVHGFAADLCIKKKSMEGLLISDVIEKLPIAFKNLEK